MEIEKIKQYIRENLFISINTTTEIDYGQKYVVVQVELHLEDEVISKSSDSIYP